MKPIAIAVRKSPAFILLAYKATAGKSGHAYSPIGRMTSMTTRLRLGAAAMLALAAAGAGTRLVAQTGATPRITVSFAASAHAAPITGMVYFAISRDNQQPP